MVDPHRRTNICSILLDLMDSYSSCQPYNGPVIVRSGQESIPRREHWTVVGRLPEERVLFIRNTGVYSPGNLIRICHNPRRTSKTAGGE